MKKFIAFAAVCGFALAFVACGKKETAETPAADSTAVEAPATPAVDSTAAADTTAHADTTAAAAPAAH